jgi:hypothetical protein
MKMTNRSSQVPVDHESHRPDRILFARGCELGNDRSFGLSPQLLMDIPSSDSKTKAPSSKKPWPLLHLGRSPETRVHRVHHRLRHQLPGSLHGYASPLASTHAQLT